MENTISEKDFKNIINNSKLLIDKTLYIFLFKLLYAIFFKVNKKSKGFLELQKEIDYINKNAIKNKSMEISTKYEIRNINNIYLFVYSQNNKYRSNILENILIVIFSFAFKIEKENSFGKYLYNDISKLKDKSNNDLLEWINQNKFNEDHEEFTNLKEIFSEDIEEGIKFDYQTQKNKGDKKNLDKCFFYLLVNIFQGRISNINYKKKFFKYLYRNNSDKKILKNNIENKEADSFMISSLITISQTELASNYLFNDYINKDNVLIKNYMKIRNTDMKPIKSLFTSVYIYYQNKHYPLIKYQYRENEDNKIIFDLSEAGIDIKFSGIIYSPLRVEPNLAEIKLSHNNFKQNGLIECAITLLFNNKNIKKVDLNHSVIMSEYIDYFNFQLGLFDNYSIEVLNLEVNHLEGKHSEFLSILLSHLKKLKTLNLSCNTLKSGASFIIMLKDLYRQGKTNLENINLNKCALDDISFYELGELLKCKYCKLKKLYLSKNYIPSCTNFLKKLKRNKSLIEIHLSNCELGNNDTKDLMEVISNTNIENLYLYKNEISDFSQLLRIIYRTKLVTKEKIDNLFIGNSYLYNLDLSSNDCFNKNIDKIELLKNGIKHITLFCLDISKVLYGRQIDEFMKNKSNNIYKSYVESLKNELEKDLKENNKIIKKIQYVKKDIEKLNKYIYFKKDEKYVKELEEKKNKKKLIII